MRTFARRTDIQSMVQAAIAHAQFDTTTRSIFRESRSRYQLPIVRVEHGITALPTMLDES